jgi:hypothetical protein
VDEDEKCFVLDVDKRMLESAPGFDKDNWPDMADTTWGTDLYRHYGETPYWDDQETKTLHGGGGMQAGLANTKARISSAGFDILMTTSNLMH